jgi:putative iron(3+)-hydroxamate import system permease protein fhuB
MITTRIGRVLLNLGLALFLILVIILGVVIGATDIDLGTALKGIWAVVGAGGSEASGLSTVDAQIIGDVRLPRAILGALVVAGLAACGLVAQSLLRNPLGDPYLLGISSGASTGAAIVMVFGASSAAIGSLGITGGAFLGALTSIVVVAFLASAGGRITVNRIIFAGMAVSYFFSAVTSLTTLLAKNAAGARSVMFWILGSLSAASWQDVWLSGVVTFAALAGFVLLGRRIDLLNLGDDQARSLGTSPFLYRNIAFVLLALTVAVLVSVAGAIGFVGLIIPHLAKLLVGTVTRRALPAAALSGAILLVVADAGARIILRPAELPIGILTAIIGTPTLMLLIRNHS